MDSAGVASESATLHSAMDAGVASDGATLQSTLDTGLARIDMVATTNDDMDTDCGAMIRAIVLLPMLCHQRTNRARSRVQNPRMPRRKDNKQAQTRRHCPAQAVAG